MAFETQVEEYEVLPVDTYDATFADIEAADSQTGGFWKWAFEVEFEGEQRRLSAASSPRLTRSTKAGQWVEAIRGRRLEPGEDFDFAAITGKPCRLIVGVEETLRGTFNRVEKVLAAKPDESPF